MSDIKDLITKYLDPKLGHRRSFGYQIKYNCPKCDRGNKYNLEICVNETHPGKYLKFNCWSCRYSGYITDLLKEYAHLPTWRTLPEFKTKNRRFTTPIETSKLGFPKDLISFHLSDDVKKYLLEERQMDEDFLVKRSVKYVYSESEPLHKNIIFPFYEEEKLIGFSSHHLETKKYKNHGKLNFVPYKELINPYFPILITEGIYDSGSVINAIPILGTKINHQIYRFCEGKKIILALDTSVSIDTKKEIANKILVYGAKKVIIFDLNDYKDLNEWFCKDKDELKEELLQTYKSILNE